MPFPLTPFYSNLSQSIVTDRKLLLILATWSHIGAQLLAEVASNPCDHLPFPLTPFDSNLSITSPNAPPRTDHQAMPFPHHGPTSEPNKYKSTRTSPTTDRSCLGTPFDSSVLTPSPNAPPTTDHFPRF